MKIELLLNLENFMNVTFVSNDDRDRLDAYEELLPCIEDWIGYTSFALKLANHIRKILGLDPYEAEYDGLNVVQKVEIKELPKSNLKNDTETKGGTFPPSFKPEVIIQDLEGITILKKLDKSYLVLKNGYTTIVAYSHLKSGDGIVEGFFGNLNDDIFDERRWILKTKKDGTPNLEWQPFIKEEIPPWEGD